MSEKKDISESQKEDFEAIRKVTAGDSSAFAFLEKKYHKIIAALIRKMVKNEEDVQDLTQETFIKAYNALDSFHFGFSFSSWIYKIASNTCIDFLRKKRFQTVSLSQPVPGSSDEENVFEIEDDSYIPDMNVLSEERIKILKEAIDRLPDNYREIIKLRHEKELDYTEISDILNIPLGTVKAHLFRARKNLYSMLKKHLYVLMM